MGGGQNPGEHTVDCGYAAGQPCGHKHTGECYTDELICGYIVDEENIASDSDAIASDSNAEHTHTQECHALDCPHERGEHKVNGVSAKSIADWTFIDDDNYLTEGKLALPGVNAGRQADFDTVVSMLPKQISAEVEGEANPVPVDITGWSCLEFAKGPDGNWPLTGEYTFTAKLQEGYVCEPMPTVKVLVGGAELYATGDRVGDFIVTGESLQYEFDNSVLTIRNGADLTIKNIAPNIPTTNRIKVEGNGSEVKITLAGVNIEDSKNNFCAFEISAPAIVTLNLEAGSNNILKSGNYRAGLEVPDGAKVIIEGDGSLDASSLGYGAGIGSGVASDSGSKSGEIEIRSGIITATSGDLRGGQGGAGIGGGSGSSGLDAVSNGKVTINGGVVTATGGGNAAGIGGGGAADQSSGGGGGIVTIGRGTVTAIGGGSGAGIGGGGCNEGEGSGGGTGSIVMISGADTKVTATGGSRGPDIGGGAGKDAGTFGEGGSLTVEEATLKMTGFGTNAKNPDYKNCTIIDKDNSLQYGNEGKAIPSLSLEADPETSQILPGDITLTAILSGAASGNGNRTITFTVNNTIHTGITDDDGKVTYPVTSLSAGTYTFGASFAGDLENEPVTAAEISGYVVNLANQTGFAISDSGAKTYGDGGFTLVTTGGQSTGGVRFSAPSGNGVLTVTENGEVSIIGAGKVTVTATKEGDDTYNQATASQEITVAPRDIANGTVSVTGSRVYTGSQLQPVFEVKDGAIAIATGDYTYSYGPNVDAGTGAGSITLTGQRNYTGTKEVSFDIEKRSLTGAAITLESGPYRYTGTEVKPAVTGVMLEGIVIPTGAFDVGYTDNTGTGTATVTITAKADSNFSGSASTTFEITKSRSSDSDSYGGNYTNPDILRGSWVQTDAGVWMFRQTGGSYAMNRWGIVDGLWYFFDAEGKMLTGWQFLGGQWYYLCMKEDAAAKAGMKEGAMATGWHFDPLYQKWFYLDTNGAMITGWREIDGKWHYFNPASDGTRGTMVTNSVIDGRYIDKNGVWVQ